jgi:PBSX family phage terminase large subunit
MTETRLSGVIAEVFHEVHADIKRRAHTHYWLKGGRGSAKSSFVSLEVILGMMRYPEANAVVLRKYGVDIKDSVFEQLKWAIHALGVEDYWQIKLSPLGLYYQPTGQRVAFRGVDDPKKIKSIKFHEGYAKFIWYEELSEFAGMAEIRNINQSLMRGGDTFAVFYTYNPPQSVNNWVNTEAACPREGRLVHHSTYLTVPAGWLGEQFLIEAKHLKQAKPEAYEHEYMGAVTGTGGEVFRNLNVREVTDEELRNFDRIRRGLDFGFSADPVHYTVCHYDKTRRRLVVFYEIQKAGMSNLAMAEAVKAENKGNDPIIADSSEPRTISELKGYGLRVKGAIKGPGSVDYGMKFLQDIEEIVIDPLRCPNTAREFTEYELEKDARGDFKLNFPDKNNHSIDAIRYALSDDMKRKKEMRRL